MTMFATGGYDGLIPDYESTVKIWDAKTGELVVTLKGHTGSVMCLAWTPDGNTLISGSVDSSIRTWNTSNWKQIAVLDECTWSSVYGIAISPNGRILASVLFDKTARLWNLDNNQPISLPLNHANVVAAVSFSPDGKLLATCCDDNNAYTWDVSAIFKEAGLDDLLLDKPDKSLPAQAHVSRRPVGHQPIKASHAYLSAQHRLRPISSPSHGGTLRSRFLSFFRPIHHDTHDTPSRSRPFHWIRNRLFARPSGAVIKLHKHPSAVVNVPYAKGKRINALARERRRLIMKSLTAGNLRPPNSTVTQQSRGTTQTQSSSQPHAAVSAPPVVNTTSNTNPHATIRYA
ncbi:WD40-repeat-containing domain protein [Suillus americanus]|nr:WD40-repeat-containing domain protein [Suillus americanus]